MSLFQFMLEKWRAKLGIKNESQKTFTASLLPGPVEGLAEYPSKAFAAEEGIYAYRVHFSVTDASGVAACIRSYFPSVGNEEFQRGRHHASTGESMNFAIYPEFKATSVALLTNSVALLRAIDALHLEPPPPWKVFPDIDPYLMSAGQGAVDYWNWMYWYPFWETISPSEREQYMQLHKPNADWIEYMEFRATLDRKPGERQ